MLCAIKEKTKKWCFGKTQVCLGKENVACYKGG